MIRSSNAWAPVLVTALLLAAACDKDAAAGHSSSPAPPPAADNTRMNERDKGGSLTPTDQGNGPADLSTTQQIRKALMDDDTLSTDAKNVKVITANGSVLLRGAVKTDAERRNIEAKALQLAAGNKVQDRLEVESSR